VVGEPRRGTSPQTVSHERRRVDHERVVRVRDHHELSSSWARGLRHRSARCALRWPGPTDRATGSRGHDIDASKPVCRRATLSRLRGRRGSFLLTSRDVPAACWSRSRCGTEPPQRPRSSTRRRLAVGATHEDAHRTRQHETRSGHFHPKRPPRRSRSRRSVARAGHRSQATEQPVLELVRIFP